MLAVVGMTVVAVMAIVVVDNVYDVTTVDADPAAATAFWPCLKVTVVVAAADFVVVVDSSAVEMLPMVMAVALEGADAGEGAYSR
jgi:hypothetical protein